MIWGTLVFLFTECRDISAFWAKHGSNLSAALKDALPLIERFRARVAPTNETVKQVEAAVKTAISDPASPMPGNEYGPTNWNPNSG